MAGSDDRDGRATGVDRRRVRRAVDADREPRDDARPDGRPGSRRSGRDATARPCRSPGASRRWPPPAGAQRGRIAEHVQHVRRHLDRGEPARDTSDPRGSRSCRPSVADPLAAWPRPSRSRPRRSPAATSSDDAVAAGSAAVEARSRVVSARRVDAARRRRLLQDRRRAAVARQQRAEPDRSRARAPRPGRPRHRAPRRWAGSPPRPDRARGAGPRPSIDATPSRPGRAHAEHVSRPRRRPAAGRPAGTRPPRRDGPRSTTSAPARSAIVRATRSSRSVPRPLARSSSARATIRRSASGVEPARRAQGRPVSLPLSTRSDRRRARPLGPPRSAPRRSPRPPGSVRRTSASGATRGIEIQRSIRSRSGPETRRW